MRFITGLRGSVYFPVTGGLTVTPPQETTWWFNHAVKKEKSFPYASFLSKYILRGDSDRHWGIRSNTRNKQPPTQTFMPASIFPAHAQKRMHSHTEKNV